MSLIKNGVTYLDTQEACVYIGVTRQTLLRYVRDGRIRQYKQGIARNVYYKQTELDTLTDMYPVDADSDVDQG